MNWTRLWTAVLCAALLAATEAEAGRRPGMRAARSRGHDRLALAAGQSKVRVLDKRGALISETPVGSSPSEMAITDDGKKVAVCTDSTGLYVITEGRAAPARLETAGDCSDLGWSPDGTTLTYVLTLSGTFSKAPPINSRELKEWDSVSGKVTILDSTAVEPDEGRPSVPGLGHPELTPPGPPPAAPRPAPPPRRNEAGSDERRPGGRP